MQELNREGLAKAIGVSNFYPDRLVDLIGHNEITPAVNQIETHPFNQRTVDQVLMREHGVQIESWGPFAEGQNNIFSDPVLGEIGAAHGKSVAQIVLRWLIQRDVIVIPKSVRPERMAREHRRLRLRAHRRRDGPHRRAWTPARRCFSTTPTPNGSAGSIASASTEDARMPDTMRRRSFLRFALAGVGGAAVGVPLAACGADSAPALDRIPPGAHSRLRPTVVAASCWRTSRARARTTGTAAGRNLKVGNTEVLARAISARLDCVVHRIEPVDPYPADYDETVQRNVREQDADARPAIATPLASIDGYETILLASPIWNVRAPMIMTTFAERYDFARKTVYPITTHAMSGLGTTTDDYGQTCKGARIGAGLAVRGEEARSAGAEVDAWLRRTRLLDDR